MSSLRSPWLFFVVLAVVAIGCSGGSGSVPPNSPTQSAGTPTPAGATPTPAGATPTPSARPTASPTPGPTATATATPVPGATPPTPNPAISFAPGFYANVVANVGGAREIAALPNGDILVGTGGSTIYIVPGAESATASVSPKAFITLSETPADSIILAPNGSLYAATNTKIWKIPYHTGDQSEPNSSATVIALVRQGPVSPGTDGDVHVSTSVAASASKLYAGVGSSCNQCIETDPTRASIQVMNLDGSGMTTLATRIRNPIAVTINPATGTLWAGGAGQDNLTYTHPYEYFDPVTLESPVPAPSPAGATYVDYGWPACEENHHLYNPLGTSPAPDCSKTVEPRVEFPAYSTLIGATFYPASQTGTYAFPSAYRGGAYVTSHGSWHCCPSTLPRLYYVPMSGDTPATAMNWSAPDPTSQSQQIMYDFGGSGSTSYIGRPTGVAVGASGSLFVGDDATGNIYRIRHH